MDFADVSKLGSSGERSSVDEKAAGRVHVRGFHYVVRHALEGISNGMKSLMVCFLLSILKWGETPTYFLEGLLKRLNLTSDQICVSMESLMKTGLVTRLGEDYSMHQVVQSHVRTIVSSSFPKVKESVVASLLQTLKSKTILSTRMTLSERAATLSSVIKTNGIFGGKKLEVDQQNKNFEIERLITTFLSVADDLQLSWKQRDLCLRCLLFCYQRRRADEDDVIDMMRDTFFESFPCDFALLNLVQDDEETVCSMLSARWTFLFEKSPKPLEIISSEISQLLSAGSTIEPIGRNAATRVHSNPGSSADQFDWEGRKINGNRKNTPRKCPFQGRNLKVTTPEEGRGKEKVETCSVAVPSEVGFFLGAMTIFSTQS